MPTSDPDRVFVWVFLRGMSGPVVAGVVVRSSTAKNELAFQYGRSYLANPGAVSFGPDLPLRSEPFPPVPEHRMPSSIRDAMPDAWGRIVIQRRAGLSTEATVPDFQYMLGSGSDRVGAIDFQESSSRYVPRPSGGTLRETADSAAEVESDSPVGPALEAAVRNSMTSVGGSQPKAFVDLDGRQWLAKFPTVYDKLSPLIKAEMAAIYIAGKVGIAVPDARMINVTGRGSVLLMERFDRDGTGRRLVVSGHTVSDQHAVTGESYPRVVERVKALSKNPDSVGRDLFALIAFRIAMRIDDDHLRNIAVFWDGQHAQFTPAYDLSPELVRQPTSTLTDIGGGCTEFSVRALVDRHPFYDLSKPEATEIAEHIVEQVVRHRADAAEAAKMSDRERALLLGGTATRELTGFALKVSMRGTSRPQPGQRRSAGGAALR